MCIWLFLLSSFIAYAAPPNTITEKESPHIESSMPAAGFTFVSNGGCAPVTVQFYSQLNGPSYSWTFGDGGTSSDCNPVHTYTTPGTYTVTLVATGGTYTSTITVGATPVVTITGDDVSCVDGTVSYTATSTIPPATYSWSATGGVVNSSTSSTASITWTSFGVNYVNYTITTADGCTKVFRYQVKVIPPPQVNLPCCDDKRQDDGRSAGEPTGEGVPGGSSPCSVCAGSYSCYQATIDPAFGTPAEYNWNWSITNGTIVSISGDGTEACVVWGSSGAGTIMLTATHQVYGCQTIKECDVVINPGITPAFSVAGNCVSSPVVFDASATTPLANIVSYFWEFGDGYTETTYSPTASHQYSFTGTYTATLTITTVEGCEYKIDQTFNVISGTRPQIECPGTACENSRQCYSTALISGATYVWSITGDDPSQRTFSSSGEEVCVTWGSGPVGTVSVTVLGGGYTCTNTATEVIPIVGNTVPINAPDYVCQTSNTLEVSTANYLGACYTWTVNGTTQSSTTNELTFNPALFSSPITVDVDVDFELGCCSGSGQTQIIKLPEYSMSTYNTSICIGSTQTYTLLFPAGTPTTPVSWSVQGGTIVSSTASSVTINWTTAGAGIITAGNNTPTQYCNDGSNNSWNVTVNPKATGDDIAGPSEACAGTTYTYYHAYESPTGSASVSVSPAGATVTAGTYSSDITFPSVAVPTTFTVSVTYNHSSISNCGTTKTYDVTVLPTAIPTFNVLPGTVCQGDIVTYTANIPDIQYYDWNVIGGTVVSQNYVGTTLTIDVEWNSTVTSSLSITNTVCGTTNTQPVTVNGKPVVIISQSDINCSTASIDLSVANVWSSYNWSTGSTSNTTTITAPGTYSVTVSNGVCENTESVTVPFVAPTPPVINSFTVTNGTSIYCPVYDQICPNITLGSGAITSYSWSFTGFTTGSSSAQCPSVALPSVSGLQTGYWTLTVTDEYGCTHSLSDSLTDSCTQTTGGPGPSPCTSTATIDITNYDPCTGQFTTTGNNISSVVWDFGGGVGGSGTAPTYLFSTPCDKTVGVTAYDTGNCPIDTSFVVSVPYVITNPTIDVNNAPCVGTTSITATGAAVCSGSGLIPSYSWTITPTGGGTPVYTATTTSSTLNVGSILSIPNGDYTASVQITISGCTKTASTNFTKGGLTAYFVSCGGCAGSPLTFIDQSIPYTEPIIKWEWSFTGPATYSSFLQNPTVTFAVPGTYNASLTITDNNGCTNTFNTSFVVQPVFAPGNILVNGTSTTSGTTIDICPNSTNILTAPSGTGYTYIWSTGDNTITTSVTEPGPYFVTVFNSNNCAAKIGPINFNYKPAPEAIIEPVGNDCSPRLLKAFLGTGYSYNWTFPPSGTSTQPYIYLTTGGSVTLTVNNLHGCTSTVTQSFSVNPTPTASLSYAPTPFCPGSNVTITASPSGGTPPYTHLWNNGNNTTSIATSNPGLYEYTVTDQNGCETTTSLDLQPALPPGLDKLPFGCYDICDPVTFCAGSLMPSGWTGQWYNGTTPFGGVINPGDNMQTTFSSSGTYTLHFIPDNPSVSCPAVSKPITINVITLPTFTISTSTTPAILCTGSGQTIVLTASPQGTQYSYNWYHNGVLVGTGYTYTASDSGTYVLEVGEGECCKSSTSIFIGEQECCFENAGVPFTQILSDITISSNEFWFDKYYIDATVTVVGNAELDLTNVDCVFGPNGRIVMDNNSFFRCNNSVLRPCEKDDIWRGLRFNDNSTGWINTTTIKNAIKGVFVTGNPNGVRLTDNTFVKCQISVHIRNSVNQRSISGNTFEIDEDPLPYPTNPTEHMAVLIDNSNMRGLIAQNEFRHIQPQNTANRYYGIFSSGSSFTASENRFNDMFRAIDVSSPSNVVALEANTVKLNNLKETYDSYQIRITQADIPVLVYENDMDAGLGDNSTAGAIYCEGSTRTHIKDNSINGFYYGVHAESTTQINIVSNSITSNSNTGILISETEESYISCNTIKSMATNASQTGAPLYGISDLNSAREAEMYSNCIYNMQTAIFLTGGGNLPNIVNNYMYNYTSNGVYNDGYTGAIGNPGGPVNAGRNTFMSNNGATGSTFDINSTVPITEGGNFGVLLTNNVTSTTGQDEFYSTSDCGQQISSTYADNQLDKYNICDNYNLDEWVIPNADGIYILKEPGIAVTNTNIDEMMKSYPAHVAGVVTSAMSDEKKIKDATEAVINSKIDKNLAARLVVNSSVNMGEYQLAKQLLQSPQLADIDKDLRSVLEAKVDANSSKGLTAAQKQVMKNIDDKNVAYYSALARDLVQANFGAHDYKFKKVPQRTFEEPTNVLLRTANKINVYPVPAAQNVVLKYNVTDAKVKGIKVISVLGAEIANFEYTVQAGEVEMDISQLAAGVYTVILVTDSEEKAMLTGRFIKQ